MRHVGESNRLGEKAKAAAAKPAAFGEDVDLNKYEQASEELPYQQDLSLLPENVKKQMAQVGVLPDSSDQRAGTFIQMDHSVVHSIAKQEGIEVMSFNQAVEKYGWLEEYLWKAVAVDTDKYTAHVELGQSNGYFIRALPGSKVVYPVQACLYIAKARLAQKVHNIVIAEEGSELHIITGCTNAPRGEPGLHIGVSEFYVKRGAKLTFTMIHNWTPEIAVRPRTGIVIEEDGIFLSNYVILKPVYSLQMYPVARCAGENAIVRFHSILVATPGSTMDVGSRVILDAPNSRAEVVSRAITTGGMIIARGYIEGNSPGVKGHLECRGLILSESGVIHAVPELRGTVSGVDLSHEAAVGKIAEEEIEYLMIRGLTRDEATAAIVRGFLRAGIEGLPAELDAEIQRAIETSEQTLL
jgi:Fe-S cluster assembly scaffold protein SufB